MHQKQAEKWAGWLILFLLIITQTASAVSSIDSTKKSEKNILFLGDSITAGLGVGEQHAYPALIQHKIDSLGWSFNVINAGLSGETSAGGLRRVSWLMQRPVNVLVLELGGNDGLRGVDLEATYNNLDAIIDTVRGKYPDAKILVAGMQVPPNLGPEYTEKFKEVYPRLAKENDVKLIPFILENVGGVDKRMQSDGIHPNEKGHKVVAENVWEVLEPVLVDVRREDR